MARSITYTSLPGIPLVYPGDDICRFIKAGLTKAAIVLQDGDIIVIAQKIISKSENRYVNLADVIPSARALELAEITGKDARLVEVVLGESTEVLRAKKNVMIVAHRLGFVMANAGIDQSNITQASGTDQVLLLPVDSDASCRAIKVSMTVLAAHGGRAWLV